MDQPLRIIVDAKHALVGEQHGCPKCVTPHHNQNLYYVDINKAGGSYLVERSNLSVAEPTVNTNPVKNAWRHIESPDGSNEKITALGLNDDGSFIVARHSGIYYFNPEAAGEDKDKWRKLCDIPLEANERPNNGVMIPTMERDVNGNRKVRFFLGTGDTNNPASAKVGKLYVLEKTNGKFELRELARGMAMVNAVSGQIVDGKTQITFADSSAGNAVMKKAIYLPSAQALDQKSIETLHDFKEGKVKAENGRPDGTSPVLFNGKPAVAVACIDSPEIRVFTLEDNAHVATFRLHHYANKPTMATFATENGKTVAYISTLKQGINTETRSEDDKGGRIYKVTEGLEAFTPINAVGTYSKLIKKDHMDLKQVARILLNNGMVAVDTSEVVLTNVPELQNQSYCQKILFVPNTILKQLGILVPTSTRKTTRLGSLEAHYAGKGKDGVELSSFDQKQLQSILDRSPLQTLVGNDLSKSRAYLVKVDGDGLLLMPPPSEEVISYLDDKGIMDARLERSADGPGKPTPVTHGSLAIEQDRVADLLGEFPEITNRTKLGAISLQQLEEIEAKKPKERGR